MAASSKASIQADIIAEIRTGNSDTTALGLRTVLNEVLDSYANVIDGGYVYQAELGYSTLLPLTDNKSFVYKKWVEDYVATTGVGLGVVLANDNHTNELYILSNDELSQLAVFDNNAFYRIYDGTVNSCLSLELSSVSLFRNDPSGGSGGFYIDYYGSYHYWQGITGSGYVNVYDSKTDIQHDIEIYINAPTIFLSQDPTFPLEAATMNYVDTSVTFQKVLNNNPLATGVTAVVDNFPDTWAYDVTAFGSQRKVRIGIDNSASGIIVMYDGGGTNTVRIEGQNGRLFANRLYNGSSYVEVSSGNALVFSNGLTSLQSGGGNVGISAWADVEISSITGSILAYNTIKFGTGQGIDTQNPGETINVGATNASVINYGNAANGTIHNFLGTAIYELQVNSYVEDKLMTLNYGGTASSGVGVGYEIEEAGLITGYFKTNSARSGWSFKAPANTSYTDFIFSATTPRTKTFQDSTSTVAEYANKLSVFASTTSVELAGVISDETGTGSLVFANAPTLVNPIVGTQAPNDSTSKAASTKYVDDADGLKQDKPIFLSYGATSTIVGFTGALTKQDIYVYQYSNYDDIFFDISGTSNSATFTFTVPNAYNLSSGPAYTIPIYVADSGTPKVGRLSVTNGSNVITLNSSIAAAGFITSGQKIGRGYMRIYK